MAMHVALPQDRQPRCDIAFTPDQAKVIAAVGWRADDASELCKACPRIRLLTGLLTCRIKEPCERKRRVRPIAAVSVWVELAILMWIPTIPIVLSLMKT